MNWKIWKPTPPPTAEAQARIVATEAIRLLRKNPNLAFTAGLALGCALKPRDHSISMEEYLALAENMPGLPPSNAHP